MADINSSEMKNMRDDATKRILEMNRRANGPRPYGGYIPRNSSSSPPIQEPPSKNDVGLLGSFDLKSLLTGNSDQMLIMLVILAFLGDKEDDCPDNHLLLLALAYILF